MKRKSTLTWMVALVMALVLVPTAQSAAAPEPVNVKYYYDFQKTTGPFKAGAFKAPVNGNTLKLKYEKVGASKYNSFAALSTPADSAVWAATSFTTVASNVLVQFDAKYMQGEKFLVPVVYIGTTKFPEFKQFIKLDVALSENWQTYTYKTSLKVSPGDLVTVAIGYVTPESVIPVGIPTTHIGAIDNVTVKIYDE